MVTLNKTWALSANNHKAIFLFCAGGIISLALKFFGQKFEFEYSYSSILTVSLIKSVTDSDIIHRSAAPSNCAGIFTASILYVRVGAGEML